MIEYTITPEQKALLIPVHRHLQTAFAVVANRKLGLEDVEPEGIFKAEGGVVAGGRDIAIMGRYLIDDWTRSTKPTREETAVAEAIKEILARVDVEGPDFLKEEYPEAIPPLVDPLRAMLT